MIKIKKIIIDSKQSRYSINKATGVRTQSMDRWFNGTAEPNLSVLKVLNHVSKDDEELLKNIKILLDE
jgi:hypothetical protein